MLAPRHLVSPALVALLVAGCGTLLSVSEPAGEQAVASEDGGASGDLDGGPGARGAEGTVGVDGRDAGAEGGPDGAPPPPDAGPCQRTVTACGKRCGDAYPDGCGGTYACVCLLTEHCNAGTCCTPDLPEEVCRAANACNTTVVDNCGRTITCPKSCSGGRTCTGVTCCLPESRDVTCAGKMEGIHPNNCGQSVNCGAGCLPLDCTGRCGKGLPDGCGLTIDCPVCCVQGPGPGLECPMDS